MQARRVGGGGYLVAEPLLTEHLGELGQKLQVLFGCLFGYQQDKNLRHWIAVRRIERDRLFRAYECRERALQAFDTAVRNGNALTKPGGAKFFTCEQSVEYN